MIHHTIDVSYFPVYPLRAVQFFKDYHSEAKIIERHQKSEILVMEKDGNNLVFMVIALENLWIMMYFSCISQN